MSSSKAMLGDDVEALESNRTNSTVPDRLYMPVSRSTWKHCTVYTTVQQKEFRYLDVGVIQTNCLLFSYRMYYSDPYNPDEEEEFVLSAKIFENDGVLISTKESFPKEYHSNSFKLVTKNNIQLTDFDEPDEVRRETPPAHGNYVAKIERQLDNSFLVCLSTCRYCDYEHGYFTCGCGNSYASYGLQGDTREVCARVKHV